MARWGPKKPTKHFAHQGSDERICKSALETEIHIRAKELIEHELKLLLPLNFKIEDGIKYRPINLDSVRLENMVHGRVPDLIVTSGGDEYLIEIAVTHFCDYEKISFYKQQKLSCIEIDMSSVRNDADVESRIRTVLFEEPGGLNYWISINPLSAFGIEMMDNLRTEVSDLRRELSKLKSKVQEYGKQERMLYKDISKLQSDKGKEAIELHQLKLLGSTTSKLYQLEAMVLDKQQELTSLEEMISSARSNNHELIGMLDRVEGERASLYARQQMFESERTKFNDYVSSKENEFAAREQVIHEKFDLLNSVETALAKYGINLEQVRAVASLLQQRAKLETDLQQSIVKNQDRLNKAIQQEYTRHKLLQKRTTQLNNEIAEQEKVLDFCVNEINKRRRDMAALKPQGE
ncbi:MAG: hypothetical protein KKE72_05080 [Gammaproteobacteria bacterium]|nr:hypothetical protein [Gammaproteobacteria bacterium]MBU2204055.1 hypothetical protein [Gammaproteobacteria bacterium]